MAISANTASASTPAEVEHVADDLGLAELGAVDVTGGEEGPVHLQELVGMLVTDDDAGLQGEQARVELGGLPDVGLALFHVHLAE